VALTAGTRIGSYEVIGLLGAGGMGEVYRARDTKLDRDVAVKILAEGFAADPNRLARFEAEAKAVAALSDPNILSIFEFGTQAGTAYAVMELLEGQTLRERLAGGPLPVRKAVEYAAQIATGLAAAHDKGIVHRDLKPETVFATAEGRVKILDFGLATALLPDAAKATADAAPTMLRTDPGIVLGTIGYLAPEQARGGAVDQRADIFALGCVLYEMLAGRRAFARDSAPETLAAIIRDDPPPLSSDARPLPAPVERVVLHCLEKRPEDRFQSARDLAFALQALASADTTSGARAAAATSHSGGPRRRNVRWVAAGASLFALAAAATFWLARWAGSAGQTVPAEATVSHILPPADSVACFRDGFSVSPDGRKIAFSSLSSIGQRLVWIRDLSGAEPVPLKGTDAGVYPSWSPDSKHVVFYSNGQLKRISADGGMVSSLCRAAFSPQGPASWGRAGTILFRDGERMSAVSEDGGEPKPTSILNATWGSFLADGKGFVFATQTDHRAFGTAATQPDRPTMIRGIADVDSIQWAGADWFMVHRFKERSLVAQRIDRGNSEVAGSPFPIAERVPAANGSPAFSVSPSGLAAFVVSPSEAQNDFASRLTWVDRGGRTVGTLGDVGGFWTVRISRDGQKVAVNPDDDVWVYDVATGNRDRISREMDSAAFAEFPIWSSRDDHLLASVAADGGFDLKDYPLSGGQPRTLHIRTHPFGPTDWSRDGRYLVFGQGSDMADLAYYDFGDKQVKQFLATSAFESFGSLSPDGHWLAYASNATGSFEVYVQPFPDGGKPKKVSFAGGVHPRWNGDGTELFFLAPGGTMMAAKVSFRPALVVAPPAKLFSMVMADIVQGMVAPYDVSPDGRKFLVIVPVQSAPVPLTILQNWTALAKR
jgi:WD40 repeat protein